MEGPVTTPHRSRQNILDQGIENNVNGWRVKPTTSSPHTAFKKGDGVAILPNKFTHLNSLHIPCINMAALIPVVSSWPLCCSSMFFCNFSGFSHLKVGYFHHENRFMDVLVHGDHGPLEFGLHCTPLQQQFNLGVRRQLQGSET